MIIAQCSICGLLLPDSTVILAGMPPQEAFDLLSLSVFLHLVQKHREHIEAAFNPMVSVVSNYLASLTATTSDPEFVFRQSAARQRIDRLLNGLTWSRETKRFYLTEQAETGTEGAGQTA